MANLHYLFCEFLAIFRGGSATIKNFGKQMVKIAIQQPKFQKLDEGVKILEVKIKQETYELRGARRVPWNAEISEEGEVREQWYCLVMQRNGIAWRYSKPGVAKAEAGDEVQ